MNQLSSFTLAALLLTPLAGPYAIGSPTSAVGARIDRHALVTRHNVECWGWDFPWMAMAAARNGKPQIAIAALLKEGGDNSRYDVRGLNGGWYLPGNGGLLYAVAMMAAGWDGCPDKSAPGFPADGSWVVKWEGLKKAP